MSNDIAVDQELDARELKCPLPILRTKKALSAMRPGEVLRVATTDPASVDDFAAFARQTGHRLLASEMAGGVFYFTLCKQ
jgi:tRNA 2-thiouridine synthesizing protein A